MKRREFLKKGMAITALAATSPLLLSGPVEAAETTAISGATPLSVTTLERHAAHPHTDRMLVDYCTARSLKTPYFPQIIGPSTRQSLVSGGQLSMLDI